MYSRYGKRTTPRLLAAAAALLVGASANAGQAASHAVLSGYADTVAGEALRANDYALIIEQLGARGAQYARDPVGASTNLCVAYIMTHEWQHADTVCDEAIRMAKLDSPSGTLYERINHDERVALAYSNRAVLRSLESHPQEAASDLAKAHSLAPSSDFVARNLAALAAAPSAPAPQTAASQT